MSLKLPRTYDTRLVTIAIAVSLLFILIWESIEFGKWEMLMRQRVTYTTCMKAHKEINKESEQKCGDMQDNTSTEFMCNKDGINCWLEVK